VIRTRWTVCASLVLTCLLLAMSLAAWADGPLLIEVNEHQLEFGRSLSFHLTASSTAKIDSAILIYRTTDNKGMTIERLDFEPAFRLELSYEVDLSHRPLKPFVEIEYWWTVEDAAGNKLTTDPRRFYYQDKRFEQGRSLAGRQVVVHWYDGDAAFGSLALNTAEQAVDRIRESVFPTLTLSEPLHLYIYAGQDDLLPALPAAGGEGVIGQAYPELRLAVMSIPPGPESSSAMRRLIPHELTHLLLYELMNSAYEHLPPWLSEGLAVASEQVADPDEALVLEQALWNDQLLPLDLLCQSFPYGNEQSHLAYAQSASLVGFIQENYGYSAIDALLAAYGDGLSCQGGVRRALGISLSRLESEWRESLGTRPPGEAFLKQAAPWLLLVFLSLPLFVLLAQPLLAYRQGQQSRFP